MARPRLGRDSARKKNNIDLKIVNQVIRSTLARDLAGLCGRRRLCWLRSGPRVGLAGLEESEVGHGDGQDGEGCVFEDFSGADRFRSGKAATVDVHMQEIRASYDHEETEHDDSKNGGPDAQAPADQHQKPQGNLRKRQCVGNELDSPRWQQLKSFDLKREISQVGRNGELQNEKGP